MGKRMLYAPRELLLVEGLPVMQTLYNLCMSAVHVVLVFFLESEHKFYFLANLLQLHANQAADVDETWNNVRRL